MRAIVDVDTAGRTVDDMGDDLAARLASSAAPYHLVIAASTNPPRSAQRESS